MSASLPIVMVARGAAAIANERGGRRGAPAVTNILTILPQKLLDEVMEDSRAALEAASVNDLVAALRRAWEEGIEPDVPLDQVLDCVHCGLTGRHTPECLLTIIPALLLKIEEPAS